MQYTDIPTWMGILSFIVGVGIVYAMGKRAARREMKRSEITPNSKA